MKIFSNLKGDLAGGLNAAIVALPIALAFGSTTGLSPINGLYGAIFLGFFAALLGGTNTLISNPTGPMSVVAAMIITRQIELYGTLDQAIPAIILIFFLAGFIQVLFGVFKLGSYVSYIPYPVISGFMSGIGAIIIILQMSHFFGLYQKFDVIETFLNLGYMIKKANNTNVILAIATIAIVYLFPKITKAVPSTLVALVVITGISYYFDLDVMLVEDKAKIPAKLPEFKLAKLAEFNLINITKYGSDSLKEVIFLKEIIFPALSIAGLGMIDSLLTSIVTDKMTKVKHKPNRELVGQGIGNMISSLFLGLPGAGTTPATVLNINTGARTRISGISHAVFLFAIAMFAGSIAEKIPFAVLSGILITVGVSVFDQNVWKDIRSIPISDILIMVVVFLLTVFWNLLFAVGIGLIMAALYFMKRMADIVENESTHKVRDRTINNIIDTFDDADDFRKRVTILTLNGPMFFGFASRFEKKIELIPDNIEAVLFDFSNVLYMDQSGAYTFRDAVQWLKDRGITIVASDIHDRKVNIFKGINVIPELIDENHIFSSVERAIHWLNQPGHIKDDLSHDDELYIPSAFSPNNDGKDDFWIIKNINKYPNCHIMISTRSNVMVYEQLNGYTQPWDGNNMRGRAVPDGKYLYELDLYGDQSEILTGTVGVFR